LRLYYYYFYLLILWFGIYLHLVIVTPGFEGQSRVHLIHVSKKKSYIIIECIEINVTIIGVFIT
jgi:hypothetical protein